MGELGRLGFQGGELDRATGILHFGERDYDPEAMRWNRLDSLGFGGGDSNEYRFVGNAPTDATDPSGKLAFALGVRAKDQMLSDFGENSFSVELGQTALPGVGGIKGPLFLILRGGGPSTGSGGEAFDNAATYSTNNKVFYYPLSYIPHMAKTNYFRHFALIPSDSRLETEHK